MKIQTLMHRNTPVATVKIINNHIVDFEKIYDINKLPIGTYSDNMSLRQKLIQSWIQSRCIPNVRPNIEKIYEKIGIDKSKLFLESAAISLTDCFWLKDNDLDIKWEDVNYYDNGFEELFANIYTNKNYQITNLHSPDITTDGYLEKFWIQSEGIPFLIKFDNENDRIQAANEVVSNKVGDLLGINTISYSFCKIGDKVGCICPSMIKSSSEELVTGLQIKHDGLNNKEHLNLHNFFKKNFREEYYKLLLLDVVLHNIDRHEKNICLIFNHDNKTMKLAPAFDNGRCLGCLYKDINYTIQDRDLKLPRDMKREDLLKEISENIKIPYISLTELENIIKSVYFQFEIPDNRLQVALKEINHSYKLLEKHMEKEKINNNIKNIEDLFKGK